MFLSDLLETQYWLGSDFSCRNQFTDTRAVSRKKMTKKNKYFDIFISEANTCYPKRSRVQILFHCNLIVQVVMASLKNRLLTRLLFVLGKTKGKWLH